MSENAFRAAGYPWRLYCGRQVIEQDLQQAVDRAGAKRAFVVCSPSVNRRTDTVRRIEAVLGDRYAGVCDGIEKDSTYASACAARQAASEAAADALIAVGGGSVIVATRAVAIFMAEPGDPFHIMTQYPEGKPAYSPRLLAPKLPIINIPTTPTSAMNRAGTGLKNPELDHRMEYFDPKTRPHSIFLDEDALLSCAAGPDPLHGDDGVRQPRWCDGADGHESTGGGRPQPCVPVGASRLSEAGRRTRQPVTAHRSLHRGLPAEPRRGRRVPSGPGRRVLRQLRCLHSASRSVSACRSG